MARHAILAHSVALLAACLGACTTPTTTQEPPLTLVNVEQPGRPHVFTADRVVDLAAHIETAVIRKGEYHLFDSRGRRSGLYIWDGKPRWARSWSPPLYTDDLKRALETATLIAARHGLLVESSAALREID